MKELFKKIIFYGCFSALGVFCAEVISTNNPSGLANPFLYLAYGLLYVFFIDALIRWNSKDFKVWYLFGALIGLITETYVAKVIFYSPNPDAYRILGVAPGAIMFIILFYHAFFSFLAPAYLAKRILNMPLPIKRKKWIDISFVFIPFVLLPAVAAQLAGRGNDLLFLAQLMVLSAIILIFWAVLLRSLGEIKNVLLSYRERLWLLLITISVYTIFLFKATNKGHGHAPLDFPLIPMLAVTAVIAGILMLLFKTLSKNKEAETKISYSPKTIRLKLLCVWLLWHIFATAALLLFRGALQPLLGLGLNLLAVGGAVTGVILFIWSLFYLIKNLKITKKCG